MALEVGQIAVGDLVMGEGTPYRVMTETDFWSRHVRADQTGPRAWGHGSWSGAEWAEEAVIPLRIMVSGSGVGGWLAAHQQLVAAFRPRSEDIELRWNLDGTEYMMRGRPRMVEPDTSTIGLGISVTRCAFVALDPHIYSGEEHSVTLGLPSTSGGLTVPGPPALNANPFFETDTSGWSGQNATIARSTEQAHEGSASLLITPDGVSASGGAIADGLVPVTPGRPVRASMWVYSPGGWNDLRPLVDWHDASQAFMSSELGSGFAVPAGQWTHLQQTLTPPAGAAYAKLRARHGGTPSASDIWYVDELMLVDPASGGLTVPFTVDAVVSAGRVMLSNAGTAPVGLRLRIDGPVSEPRVSLLTDDGTAVLRLQLNLGTGQWLEIDTSARTVYLQGTASRRGLASVNEGGWPLLPPGSAELAFDAATFNASARLSVAWRDAWW